MLDKVILDPNNDSIEGWGGLTGDGGTVFIEGFGGIWPYDWIAGDGGSSI